MNFNSSARCNAINEGKHPGGRMERSTMMISQRYLALIVAFSLFGLSAVDGRSLFTSSRRASTWKLSRPESTWKWTEPSSLLRLQSPSTAFLHAATVPKQSLRHSDGSSPRLAFLSRLVHDSSSNASRDVHHLSLSRIPYSAKQISHHTCLYLSKANENASANDDDDECSLQKLYQQVQEEDAEWYYQTFSKLLEEDPVESFDGSCGGDEKENEKVKDGELNKEKVDLESKDEIDGGIEAEGVAKSGEQLKDDVEMVQEKATTDSPIETVASVTSDQGADEQTMEEGARMVQNNDEKKEEIPADDNGIASDEEAELTASSSGEKQPLQSPELKQSQQQQQQQEEEQPPPLQQPSSKKNKVERQVQEKYYEDDDEYEDLDEYDEDDYEDDMNDLADQQVMQEVERPPAATKIPQTKQPAEKRNKPKKPTIKTSLSQSPQIVRLRNIYTNEIENLAPLSTLSKLGYSEKELVVLRPQVLELIVEDGIPRPKKGLPKRWVRLNKLEGYEGEDVEEESEDDEDYGWDVEVVSRDNLRRDKEMADEEEADEDQSYPSSKKVEAQESVTKKVDTSYEEDMEDDEPAPKQRQSKSQQTMQSNDEKVSEQVSESWGPFTSSRVPEKSRVERAVEDDEEEEEEMVSSKAGRQQVARRSRPRQQQPLEEEDERGDSYDRGYDDERADSRRHPTPKRRQRDYDEYGEPQRSRGGQQRQRQRQRPSGRRKELVIDRGNYDDNPPPNKFWMDLPTFQNFLRKEAQLRLKILGPDWKESVLDESRWRYDLYKTWLVMLDEGVGGENPLYEYGDRPRESRQRKRRRPAEQQPRRRSEREYDRSSPRPRERQRRQPERDDDYDYDDEDYDRPMRQSDRQPSSRSQREPRAYRPPPRKTRGSSWKNFSDLEESLTRSSQEKMRSDDGGYPDEEEEKYYDEDRRRQRRSSRQQYNDRQNDEFPAKEEYDDSFEEEADMPRRRSRRGGSSASRSQGQSSRRKNEPIEEDEDYD